MTTEPPLNPDAPLRAQPERAQPERARPRVLIVDDETALRTGLSRFLQSCGYETVTAQDADEALAAVRSGPRFSLMLCDVQMPGTSGAELVPMIHAIDGDIAVIMLSGMLAPPVTVPTWSSGRIEHVMKPVELPVLEQHVARLLQERSHQIEQRAIERLMLREEALRAAKDRPDPR